MFYFDTPSTRSKKNSATQRVDVKPKERYILYFDILGYKAYFENKENDVMEFLTSSISLLNDISEEAKQAASIAKNLRYKTFSDNFIFMVEDETQDKTILDYLIQLTAHLQLSFLTKYKILVRGAICFGEIYLDERIVFGEGLVKAVSMEDAAIYPRIIIDDRIIKTICPDVADQTIIRQDSDGKYYVDYFSDVKVDDVYQPNEKIKKSILRLRDSVYTLIKKHGCYDGRISEPKTIEKASRVINKHIWLLVKYNEAIIRENLPVRIKYDIVVNTKLFRLEIVNVVKNPWPVVCS